MNKFILNYKLTSLIFFLVIFFVSNRGWFFGDILFGHNWDVTQPDFHVLSEEVKNLSYLSITAKSDHFPLLVTHLPHNALFSFLSGYFSPSVVLRIVLFFGMLTSYLSMMKLSSLWIKMNSQKVLIGVLYAFSPFYFSIVIAGSLPTFFISYPIAPLFAYTVLKYFECGYNRHLFVGTVSGTFVFSFIQYMLLIDIVILVIIMLNIKDKIYKPNTILTRMVIFSILFVLLNAYWILPLYTDWSSFNQNVIKNAPLVGEFLSVHESKHDIFSIFTMTGFFNRNFYINSIPDSQQVLFYLYVIGLWCIVVYALRTKKKNLVLLTIIYLLLMLFVKGGNYPFQDLFMSIYENVFIFKIYRSPQNLFFISVFLFCIILSISLATFDNLVGSRISYIFLLLIPIYLTGWVIDGEFGSKELKNDRVGHLDFYYPNDDLKVAIENNYNRSIVYNELFIPSETSLNFFTSDKNKYGGQGDDPNYSYLKNYSSLFLKTNDDVIKSLLQSDLDEKFFKMHNIRYITVRNDVGNHFRNIASEYSHLANKILEKKYKKVYSSDSVNTYIVSDNDFGHRFAICDSANLQDVNLNTFFDYAVDCVVNENKLKPRLVEFSRLDRTKYRVRIKGVRKNQKFMLKLKVPYDTHWSLYPYRHQNQFESNSLKYKEQLIDQYDIHNNHVINYGVEPSFYDNNIFISRKIDNVLQNNSLTISNDLDIGLVKYKNTIGKHTKIRSEPDQYNGWDIDFNLVINNYPESIKYNKNGLYDIDFIVVHNQQFYLELGRLISFISFISFIIISVIYFLSGIYNEKTEE